MTHIQALVLMIPRDKIVLNQDKGQNKKYLQNLQKFSYQRGLHIKSYSSSWKISCLNKSIIWGYLKPIHAIPTCNSICQPKCNTLVQTKRNRKLYALTCMQTNNWNEKHEVTLPLCLNKALLRKWKKVREGKRKYNIRISLG